ncbi:MAG TPA: cyclopropane fatty acyl phospholipid synthase [Candidatus Sulfotelmatobacter sp.]|nr:cyclopropane fatty acyl phospholipid synthase [Candidatus Sulfotelmatobacter sp.]
MASAEVKIGRMLEEVGCELNGSSPWDPQVHNPEALELILRGGTLAAGETYMDGMWDCQRLDMLSERMGGIGAPIKRLGYWAIARAALPGLLLNLQSPERARQNAEHHYNIGNELYESMLGETMAYSCAYFDSGARNLDEAQEAKFDLICRKLKLEPGMSLLDIGCGWGGLLSYVAKKYDIEAMGITPAGEQVQYIKEHGLDCEVRQQDWREVEGLSFDRVVSVGMFEHVGQKNYRAYFQKVHELLTPGGLSLLHTIGAPRRRYTVDPFIHTYIFPGGRIPAASQIYNSSGELFEVADFHDIGPNYDPTLMAWNENFQAAWPDLAGSLEPNGSTRYNERFKRMWEYYLLTCAGSFRNRTNRLFQFVMGDENAVEGYEPVR